MSEFYSLRRASIKDATALLAFVFGWFAAAPIAWPYIKAGFEGGDPTKGVLRFALVVFGVAIACGTMGLGAGWLAGWGWERLHRYRRSKHPVAENVVGTVDAAEPRRERAARIPLPTVRYDSRVPAADYLALARRTTAAAHDERKIGAALDRTANVSAWDGDRLIGVARVLTDGYATAALAEILVDPDFQRRGLGRELIRRAIDVTPRGMMTVTTDRATGVFFDRVGGERGPLGFVIRWKGNPDST